MKHSTLVVREHTSGRVDFSKLILSVRLTSSSFCDVVIGYPGLPNVVQRMENGDAVLFQTTEDGVLEVRAIALNAVQAEFLVSQVSPRPGLIAGFVDEDPNNSAFSEAELARIAESISSLKTDLSQSVGASPEQLSLISRKLDEIQAASSRLGRKDWVNYVAGTITTMCVTAAFAPDVTKSLFKSLNAAFAWLFTNAAMLLG